MADKGGVVGIYLMPFLGGHPGPGKGATTEMLVRHIEHAIKVCGVDHVGIGSDLSVTPIEETPEYLRAERAFAEGRARRGSAAPDEDRQLFIPAAQSPAPSRRRGRTAGGTRALGGSRREDHRRQFPPRAEGHLDGLTRWPAS